MSEILNGVAVITLDNSPVNSLSHALRERIVQALDAALANPSVRAIVLTGNDKAFPAGADVTEFGTSRQLQEPILRSVIDRIERSMKPVVAAITGVALGGGLELALGCRERIALNTARIGLPEIRAINPRLIYCSITGFGQDGPLSKLAGYDFIVQAMGGLMSITGERDERPGGGPQKVGVAFADLMTGMYAPLAFWLY